MRARGKGLALAILVATATGSFHIKVARSQELGTVLPRAPRFEGADRLAAKLDAAIGERSPALADARIGVAVVDLSSGRLLYQRDGDSLYNTASNTKLATTAAALALLGPDFRFHTGLYAEEVDATGVVQGDLYVRGRGDPSFDTTDLYDLARDLSLAGVKRVRGAVVVDDSYFDEAVLPPHFEEQPDEQAAFRAPIGATSLNFNSVVVLVRPASKAGSLAQIFVDPPNDYVKVEALVQTVATGRNRIRIDTEESARHLEIKIAGQIRVDAPPHRYRRRVPHPARFLSSALRTALGTYGIAVDKSRFSTGEVPTTATPLASLSSPPLSVLIRGLGKYSNNYVAEMLLKSIGAEIRAKLERPATWEDGLSTVRQFLVEEVGLPARAFRYDNGSGLFDSNGFSPRQMVKILATAYRDYRYGPDFLASLSIAGTDGTLKARMDESSADRLVRAKTGTLAAVSALSGYAAVDGRLPLAFAIFVNDFPEGRTGAARSLQDTLAAILVDHLKSESGEPVAGH